MKQVLRLFILLGFIVGPWVVKGQVTASFTGSPRSGCAPVVFTATDVSTPSGSVSHVFYVYWNSPSGPRLISSGSSPFSPATFILDSVGYYNIVDSAYNSSGTVNVDSMHDYVLVSSPILTTSVTTSHPALDTNVCLGQVDTFINVSQTVAGCSPTFIWTISGPTGTTTDTTYTLAATVTYTFSTPGAYNVTITETACNSCNGFPSAPYNVNVQGFPVACFSNNDSTSCSIPSPAISFTNCSTGATHYLWQFGDGVTSTAINPSHSYSATGTITDDLIAYSSYGCADTVTKTGNIIVSNFVAGFTVSDSVICANDPITTGLITVTDTTSAAVSQYFHDNYAPTSHSSFGSVAGFTYTTPGTYTITMGATSASGCAAFATHTVTVKPVPAFTFTASPLYRCSPNDTVTLTATLPSPLSSYEWHFGNGNNALDSSNVNPTTHIYSTAGTFKDSLRVTGTNGCSSLVTGTNNVVIAAPVLTISIPVDSGCVPFPVAYSTSILPAAAGGYTIDSIRFGDSCCAYIPGAGITSGSHTYHAGGVYTMMVTYTLPASAGGCTYTQPQTVTVGTTHPIFSPVVSADSVCPNTVFSVTGNCTNCSSFRWNFNPPAYPTGSTVFVYTAPYVTTHQYPTSGQYFIQAIADDAGCTDTLKDSVYVFPPAASLHFSIPDCSHPNVVQFDSAGSTGATGFLWNFGDNTTSTSATPLHTYTIGTGQTYTVTFVDSAGGAHHCYNTASLVINLFPLVDTVLRGNDTSVCKGQSVTFTGTKTKTGINDSEYIWLWGDGSNTIVTNSNSATHTYAATGHYRDTLVVKYNGCYDTGYSNVTVAGLSGGLTVNGVTNYTSCVTLNALFQDNNTDFTGFTITHRLWNFNAPPSVAGVSIPTTTVTGLAADTTITYPEGGYTIILVDSDNIGCTATNTVFVTAQKPHAYFYSADSSVKACTGIAIPFHDTNTNCTYAWSFGDGTISTVGPDVTHIYSANGVYPVSVTITTTAGGSILPGCRGTYTRLAYITIDSIDIGFNLSVTSASCPPQFEVGSNTTTPLSGYTYQWRVSPFGNIVSTPSPTNLFYTLNSATTYSVTLIATSPIGCMDSLQQTVVISGPSGTFQFTPDSGCAPLTSTLCFADTSTSGVTPSGYAWSYGDGNVYNGTTPCTTHSYLNAGIYHPYVIVTTPGCVVQLPLGDAVAFTDSIVVFPAPTVTVTPHDTAICYNSPITLTATGAGPGGTYDWSPAYGLSSTTDSSVRANPLVTTTYTITGTTIHGCSDTVIRTITVDHQLFISITGNDSVCDESKDTLLASGSGGTGVGNYTWIPNTGGTAIGDSFIAVGTGSFITYTVVYTDAVGCKADTFKNVIVNQLPQPITGVFTVCAKSTTLLSDTPPGGLWSSNDTLVATINNISGLVTGISPGVATISYGTGVGCNVPQTVTVTPTPSVIVGRPTVCVDDTTTLTDSTAGGVWSIPAADNNIASISAGGTVTGISAGPTPISYTLSDGCSASTTITVEPLPVISFIPDPAYICKRSSAQISANPGEASYLWEPNIFISNNTISNPVFRDTSNMVYSLTEISNFGCKKTDSISVTVFDSSITSISNDTTICFGQSAYLNAYSSAYADSYTWYPTTWLDNPNKSNPIATPDSTITYTVFIKENPCFNAIRSETVNVIPLPVVSVPTSSTIIAGSSVQLTASISNNVYVSEWLWAPASTLSCDTCYNPIATPTMTTVYTVTATTPIGCQGQNEVQVNLICVESSQVFVPNTFTPNGDGNNDRFYLSGKGLGLITRMSIYNRWGEKVFEAHNINANDPGAGWDGTYRGQVLDPAVFIYVFDLVCETGVPFTLKGDVTLVR